MGNVSIKAYIPGNPVPVLDGVFHYGAGNVIDQFFNSAAPCNNVLMPVDTVDGNNNVYDGSDFTYGGVGLSSIPKLDNAGVNNYNIYKDGGDYFIEHIWNNTPITMPVNVVFASIPDLPPKPVFKPKAMSYTEYLRSKTSTEPKVLNTKKLRDASEITTANRLGASRVFPVGGAQVGAVNSGDYSSMAPMRAVMAYQKTSGGRVKDASTFAAYRGGQAIGTAVQAGLPPGRIIQVPGTIIESQPVGQSASDFVRQTQGCKVSLGDPHDASQPPVFTDNTIRNLGNPSLCATRPFPWPDKAQLSLNLHPSRPVPSVKGNLEPGKDAGAFGGNDHYKAGAALRKIPHVEKHHGNDLNVNPKQPFVKYQIPGGVIPPHLKANMPICTLHCPAGYRPAPPLPPIVNLTDIATLTSPGTYTLNLSSNIPGGYTLTIPLGITLKIPPGLLLTNNGTIVCLGTIDNDDFVNNGRLIIESTGTFITTVLFTNTQGTVVTNHGSISITSTGTITNDGTIENTTNATLTNSGTIANNNNALISNNGTITNNLGSIFTSNGALYNDGTITNNLGSTFTSNGALYNNGTITTYVPLTDYATLDGNTYTLQDDTNFLADTIVTVPASYTLVIPSGLTAGVPYNYGTIIVDGTLTLDGALFHRGTIVVNGTLTTNAALDNGGSITNSALGTINITNGSLNFSSGGSLINNGNVTINGGAAQIYNFNTVITNNGTIDIENAGTFYASGATLNTSTGTITIYATGKLFVQDFPLRNRGTITNNGTITNTNTIFNSNGGIITNNGSYSGGGTVNNANGSGACGTGTLNGTAPITPTGTACPPS